MDGKDMNQILTNIKIEIYNEVIYKQMSKLTKEEYFDQYIKNNFSQWDDVQNKEKIKHILNKHHDLDLYECHILTCLDIIYIYTGSAEWYYIPSVEPNGNDTIKKLINMDNRYDKKIAYFILLKNKKSSAKTRYSIYIKTFGMAAAFLFHTGIFKKIKHYLKNRYSGNFYPAINIAFIYIKINNLSFKECSIIFAYIYYHSMTYNIDYMTYNSLLYNWSLIEKSGELFENLYHYSQSKFNPLIKYFMKSDSSIKEYKLINTIKSYLTYNFKEKDFNNEIIDSLLDIILTNSYILISEINELVESENYKNIKKDIKNEFGILDKKILYNIARFLTPSKGIFYYEDRIRIEIMYYNQYVKNVKEFINQEFTKSNSLPEDV